MRVLFLVSLSLSLIACGSSETETQANRSLVYINDMAVQCEFDGLSQLETAKNLSDYGVEVFESSCGYVSGISVAAQCGLGDMNINIHLIAEDKVIEAQNIGFELVSTLENNDNLGYETFECQ